MSEHCFFLSAEDGDLPKLKKIIKDFNIDINSQNNRDKESALTLALRHQNNDVALHLIDIGINIHLKNNRGDNALIIASSTSNDYMVDILIERGIDVNVLNLYGDTALIMASHSGFLSIVEKLYNAGSNLNIRNRLGQTALLYSVSLKRPRVVEYLISKGARLEYQNMWSETVFTLADRNFDKQMLNFLIETYTKQCCIGNFEPLAVEEYCLYQNNLKEDFYVKNIVSKVKKFLLLHCLDEIYMLPHIDIYYTCSFC